MAIAVSMRGVPCIIESEDNYKDLGYTVSILTSKSKRKEPIKEKFYDNTKELAIPISIGDYIIKKQKIQLLPQVQEKKPKRLLKILQVFLNR